MRPAGASAGASRLLSRIQEATELDELEVPEIVILNEAALDVEELEARLEIASMVPNEDCWVNCKCNFDCGVNICT